MPSRIQSTMVALAAAAALVIAPVHAQQSDKSPDPRPRDATKNKPSDTGAQTTQPSGAVTGAGHPQGTLPQPDYGKPGGLEEQARKGERSEGKDATRNRSDRKASGKGEDKSKDTGGASGGAKR
jgi:hypothetical protein